MVGRVKFSQDNLEGISHSDCNLEFLEGKVQRHIYTDQSNFQWIGTTTVDLVNEYFNAKDLQMGKYFIININSNISSFYLFTDAT